MNKPTAALLAACILTVLAAPTAAAAPAEVAVRVEGKTETLFEGPVLTDGHNVRGITDTAAPPWGRRCDGLNNGANPTPRPTPTAAAVDAMAIVGEGFDGDWYGAESFDDYFITQWGPEREDVGAGDYWGVVVDNVFTSVGGCQYQLDTGDEVLWVYDAFDGRPQLVLYPGDYSGGSVRLTATATLGVPFEITVEQWSGGCCASTPPPAPTRSAVPYEGAEVAPVVPTVRGFERVDTASAKAVATGADGAATITFETPGWHRIKATVVAGGEESVVRSNRLDVCVPEPPATGCGPLPADDQVRQPPPSDLEPEPGPEGSGEDPAAPSGTGGQSAPVSLGAATPRPPALPDAERLRITAARLDRSRIAAGVVGVGWRVEDAGPGIASWRISSRTLGRRAARYVTRASGTAGNSTRVRLPRGARYALRLTLTDLLGRSSSLGLGTVRVPG